MKKTFLITYIAYDANGKIIKEGQFNVKNQSNELSAKCNFEKYLERKYKNFSKLIIIECKEDVISAFNNMFGSSNSNPFNDMFGKSSSNPFGNF